MPHRSYASTANYRFGFNGKENDNEPKGLGNQQDYGMRIYDPRLGKFLSVDPLSKSYPWNSPFGYAEGDPINYIDIDGAETGGSTASSTVGRTTTPIIELSNLEVTRDGTLRNTTQLLPNYVSINSGMYAPQTKAYTSEELMRFIPPNAQEVHVDYQKKLLVITGVNGNTWAVSLLKQQKPQEPITWTERAVERLRNQMYPVIKQDINTQKNNLNSSDDSKNKEQFIYRAGAFTDLNFTPREGKDDGKGPKSGLSAFTDPLSATQGKPGKVQILSVRILEEQGFIVTIEKDGHAGIRPRTQKELEEWAATRSKVANGSAPSNNTVKAKSARIGEASVKPNN